MSAKGIESSYEQHRTHSVRTVTLNQSSGSDRLRSERGR